jgi:hypothetical protein
VKAQQFAPGQPVVEAEVLRQEADLRARAHVAERRAEHRRLAAARRHEPEEHLERRRLAGAVRPEKAEHLPRPTDRERSATATFAPNVLRRPRVVRTGSFKRYWTAFAISTSSTSETPVPTSA